ncbi:ISL3 family transposase [Streptomyces sp. CA-106131]|uniref:ISL3 family transposase n=1 Tax=Streptomyces sp. CA-106131 TaxID=3240045 RepID=UPI003D8D0CAA
MAACGVCSQVFPLLFPHLSGVRVLGVEEADGALTITAETRGGPVACPGCGTASVRVHSRYRRRLADAAIGYRPVVIDLSVRRLFCDAAACRRRTFAEQVPDLTFRHGRRTAALQRTLTAIAVVLSGRAGARLAAVLHARVGRMTLLRLLAALPDPAPPTPTVLGIDDFALGRGHRAGTILVDCQTHRPVDLLPAKDADTVADWLAAHPGVTVICRDRDGAYDEGGHRGAPRAVHVADRWHLWHNLGQHVERAVSRLRAPLREGLAQAHTPGERAAAQVIAAAFEDRVLVQRTRQRFTAVHGLLDQGYALGEIARELGLGMRAVRRFARAASVEEVLAKALGGRVTALEDFTPYLHRRWDQGMHSPTRLCEEIRALGYTGTVQLVRRYLAPLIAAQQAPPAAEAPKVKRLTAWIMSDPQRLRPGDRQQLKQALEVCPELDALTGHVRGFAALVTRPGERNRTRLRAWTTAVLADDQPELRSFVRGIEQDWSAVLAGVTLPWSTGVVEGTITKTKLIKRRMYGRAGFPLLRTCVLAAQ